MSIGTSMLCQTKGLTINVIKAMKVAARRLTRYTKKGTKAWRWKYILIAPRQAEHSEKKSGPLMAVEEGKLSGEFAGKKTYAWHMDTTKSTKPSQTQLQKSWRAALPLLPQVWCDLPRHDMPKKSCATWKSTLFLIKGQLCQGSCYFGRLWHRNFPAVLGCQWPHSVIQSQSNDYNAYDGWSGILKVQNKYAVYFNQLVHMLPNQHRTSWYQ